MYVPLWCLTTGTCQTHFCFFSLFPQSANAQLPLEEQRAYVLNPLWLFGFAIYILGNISNAFALTLSSQSVIRCVADMRVLLNMKPPSP